MEVKILFPQMPPFFRSACFSSIAEKWRNPVQDWLFWTLHTLILPLILFFFGIHPFKYVYYLPLELLFAV